MAESLAWEKPSSIVHRIMEASKLSHRENEIEYRFVMSKFMFFTSCLKPERGGRYVPDSRLDTLRGDTETATMTQKLGMTELKVKYY